MRQLSLELQRRNRGFYREDWSDVDNAMETIKYLEMPTSWGGEKFIIAFSHTFCARVEVKMPGGVHNIGESGEQLKIHFNGTNHYSGMKKSPRAAEQAESRKQTNTQESPAAIRKRVKRHRSSRQE